MAALNQFPLPSTSCFPLLDLISHISTSESTTTHSLQNGASLFCITALRARGLLGLWASSPEKGGNVPPAPGHFQHMGTTHGVTCDSLCDSTQRESEFCTQKLTETIHCAGLGNFRYCVILKHGEKDKLRLSPDEKEGRSSPCSPT